MPKIIFVSHTGVEQTVKAKKGASIMEAAIKNSVDGIDADCGGACACATCHVYIEAPHSALTGTANDTEQALLDFAEDVNDNSRLSCQIRVTKQMDGLVVKLPANQ